MNLCSGLVLVFLLNVLNYVKSQDPPIVELSYGKLQGDFNVANDGTKYEAFMGVPYAQPPVGKLRFEEPQPPSNWTGIYNATVPGDYCLQFCHVKPAYTIRGKEDCLYLDLYRPLTDANRRELLDVIVYIHGGAFMFFGSRNYKSVELIKKNFILIAFNYRLGPFGFLSTGDEVVPGNMGLKDQVAVLKWIQENIRHFGGNPSSVTISGMSAGGASVHFHILSPLSKGLFSKAISHSGVATNPWALAEAAQEKAKKLAASLQCPTNNTTAMISCLKSVSGEDIVKKVPLFQEFLYAPFSPFGPIIEPDYVNNTFLPDSPQLAHMNATSKVPWLVGFTSAEGLYPAAEFIENEDFLKKLDTNWNTMAPHLLEYNYTATGYRKNYISNKIKRFYFPNKKIHESPKQLIKLLSERLFESGIAYGVAKYILSLNTCDKIENVNIHRPNYCSTPQPQVYMYRFGYTGNFTGAKVFNFSNNSYGVNHGDDLLYLFDNKLFDKFANDKDMEMQKRLINMYDTFIRKSTPQFLDGVAMPPILMNATGLAILDIQAPDSASKIEVENPGNLTFWLSVPLLEIMNLRYA